MTAKKPLMYANLHTHTTHSDGVYSPAEMARIAKAEGYSAIAVTDHDTVTGNEEIKAECQKLGMETIFGCEFMTHSDVLGLDFHLTAFDFDAEMPEMKEYLRKCSYTMTERTRACFEIGLNDPMDCIAHQAPPSMGFSRQEYWSGVPLPSPPLMSKPH